MTPPKLALRPKEVSKRQSRSECDEGVAGQGVGGEKEVMLDSCHAERSEASLRLSQRPFATAQGDIQKWFMGQVACATKGKADPNVTKELLVKALEERRK